MADKRMYFGTPEHMEWVPQPNSGMGRDRVGWITSGTYLNGGGWSRQSSTTHFEPTLTWSFLNHRQVRQIMDYWYGAYGPGPIRWLDGFAMSTNVLSPHWSIPRLAWDDAPSLIRDVRPTLSATPANSLALPSRMATYDLLESSATVPLKLPVPEGFSLHVAVWGTSSGTGALRIDGEDVTLTDPSDPGVTWNALLGEGSDITLELGGNGSISLAGCVAQILPNPGTPNPMNLPTEPSLNLPSGPGSTGGIRFLSGEGHSGVVFKSKPSVTGYSSANAIDYQSLTAEFIEVGAWQQ